MAAKVLPRVFGIDIIKGSANAGDSSQYALTVLSDDDVIQQRVSRRKLMRLISEKLPDIIAVDSYTELAPDKKGLVRLLRCMPPGTRLVQVCGVVRGHSLPKVASEHDIKINPKNPFDESMAISLLARRGVGHEVTPFDDVVVVKVSRARALGRGGWSQNRYRRRVQGAVRTAVREIEDALAGMDYDLEVQEGFGGLVHGIFTVRAPRKEVPVHPRRTGDVQVTVRAREKEALEFISLQPRERSPTIVGVDPGTTLGVAVMDFDGRVIEVVSKRNASFETLIELAGRHGPPLVIACDVFPVPGLVEKLKRAYGAEIWAPSGEHLSVEEKNTITRVHGPANDHQRDALAAAIKAYRSMKKKLGQLKQRAPPWADIDELRERVVRGQNIEEAITGVSKSRQVKKAPPAETTTGIETPEIIDDLRRRIREREEQLETMRAYIDELKGELKSAEKHRRELEGKMRREVVSELARVKRDKEFKVLKSTSNRVRRERDAARKEINRLQSMLEDIRHADEIRILPEGRVAVKVMDSLTRDGIEALSGGAGIRVGDVIYIENPGGGGAQIAERLIDAGVAAVISKSDFSHHAEERFHQADVPLLDVSDVGLKVSGDIIHVGLEEMEGAMLEWRRMARQRGAEEKNRWLDSLVSEYRHERKKGTR